MAPRRAVEEQRLVDMSEPGSFNIMTYFGKKIASGAVAVDDTTDTLAAATQHKGDNDEVLGNEAKGNTRKR